ncbi:MAG TPA: response regulator [Verrucomicrobiae bacterium]|nr:response regulator [Verrucomicrobiae bacterium]
MNKKRILVVDDEPGITRSLKLNLEATQLFKVRTENESIHVLKVAHEFQPDLILLDVVMPDPYGCRVAAQLHADPELKDTPVVFLTALAHNEETGGHAVAAGARVYLAKPVDITELVRCIEEHVRR